MAKARAGKIENTIELCRSEGKWQKSIELAEELKASSPSHEALSNFLIGEGKLESYLEENPPVETNFGKARIGLADAKRLLISVCGEDGRKAGLALDSHLLLAKLYYACGEFEESLEHFKLSDIDSLKQEITLSSRTLRILAESYASKGLCIEAKNPKGTSKFKTAEMETEMINCFERAADIGLLYLQSQEGPANMGAILETALQRSPIVLIKLDRLQAAIDRYRCMLSAVETKATQSLRLTLARQLAEVLLRGVSGTLYTPPSNNSRMNTSGAKKLWMPRRYTTRNQFIPKNQHEETLLLLLIAEALANRDAVLSQSPEFRIARLHALGNVTAVYDLLTLATVRWGQISFLHDSFEKALKFSFNEPHIWKQYALSLISLNRYQHALNALKDSTKLSPCDTVQLLMSAKICYEQLGLIHEGLQFSYEALKKETKGMRSRANLFIGIGLQQLAITTSLKSERDLFSRQAIEAFEKAVQIDQNDHLSEYYLALQHAINYNISEALVHIKTALMLRAEHSQSLHLFALLLTANHRPYEAMKIIEDALDEFPDNLNLMHTRAHLELYLKGSEQALNTLQKMISLWKDLYESQTQVISGSLNEFHDDRYSETKSVVQYQPSLISDKDSNSIHPASLAASRVDHALSEAASSLSSFTPRPGSPKAWSIQLKIWILLADIYLASELPNEAENCIQEAMSINPLSHHVMYMKGKANVYLNQWQEAKQCYLNAVSANPLFPEALRALGEAHYYLGEPRLAEKYLKDAAKIDPNCPNIWYTLGKVMESLDDFTASSDCMATSLSLEPSCPVLPFTSINLAFD
ncbi:tetratricopeptide repeat protein 7B [Chironomus tepperi]|uniref:tetratricopeptide repeat protein 7B n=1 Tax=Chironomus tepperi TaxID=113505 RepID=UPI00391F1118